MLYFMVSLKDLLLFITVCGLGGVCILFGSVLGNGIARRGGLFAGAIVGGVVGVAAAVMLAVRFGLLDRPSYGAAFLGGMIGFIIAAVIAVKNLRGPVIPVMSIGLVGLGAIIGKALSRKE
jgi:hypothetical protein